MELKRRSILPGFGLTMGYTLIYLSLIVLIPLSTIFLKTAELAWTQFWSIVTAPRVVAAYRLSIGASAAGALINSTSDSRRLGAGALRVSRPTDVDALVDLPFRAADFGGGNHAHRVYAHQRMDRPLVRAARDQGLRSRRWGSSWR